MAKQSLADKMKAKSPQAMRQVIQPVDILAAAAAGTELDEKTDQESERKKRTVSSLTKEVSFEQDDRQVSEVSEQKRIEKEPEKSERKKRSRKSLEKISISDRTEKPRIYSDEAIHTILTVEKRSTERYSFEIYTDQKLSIEHLRRIYEQKTGMKLSASRLIREILDSFLPEALALFEEET